MFSYAYAFLQFSPVLMPDATKARFVSHPIALLKHMRNRSSKFDLPSPGHPQQARKPRSGKIQARSPILPRAKIILPISFVYAHKHLAILPLLIRFGIKSKTKSNETIPGTSDQCTLGSTEEKEHYENSPACIFILRFLRPGDFCRAHPF
jgi:hypothetical protein